MSASAAGTDDAGNDPDVDQPGLGTLRSAVANFAHDKLPSRAGFGREASPV